MSVINLSSPSKMLSRKEKNQKVEDARREHALAKRARKKDKAQKAFILRAELQEKLDAEKAKQDQIRMEEETRLNALPPKTFFFTITTDIPGRVYAREHALLYGLSEEERDEVIKLKWIDRLRNRPIHSCSVVEWGDYKED